MAQDKTHGLEGIKAEKETQHWFLNDKILNLERRIVLIEQQTEGLLKEWQELRERIEQVMGEWAQK